MDQLQLPPIRNAGLYSALRGFVEGALTVLRAARADGADVSFSVEEHRAVEAARRPFYEYRPMVERFVRDRLVQILELKSTEDCMWVVASDPACGTWLRAGRADAVAELEVVARDEVLVPFLMSLAELDPSFELDEAALLQQYLRLERAIYVDQRRYVAVVPLWGVRLIYGDLELAAGVTLRQVDPELFRLEWPEGSQLNWGEQSRDGLPVVLLQFERAVAAADDEQVLDPLPAVVQVVSVIRALAGGSVHAGPCVLERFDFQGLAPRPVPAIAARPCGQLPSRIDATVARSLPTALRRLSTDPHGAAARALERYQLAATLPGLGGLRAAFDSLVEIYADEREVGSAALRCAAVLCANLAERRELVDAMRSASLAIREARPIDASTEQVTRLLAACLRATIAAALVGELPLTSLKDYADSVIIGERDRKQLGVAAMKPQVG